MSPYTKPLTKQQAIEMQEALIAEYSKPSFQAKLRFVLRDGCSAEDKRKVDQELRELREGVGAKFGFEASPEGVAQSIELFTPALRADPQITQNCNVMNILLYPQLQDEINAAKKLGTISEQGFPIGDDKKQISMKCRGDFAARYEAERAARKNAFVGNKNYTDEKIGRNWAVIGGCTKGILVRKSESLHSAAFPTRLASNSVVEELELIGDRLHYKKIGGDGPDFGWVSIMVRGATLLKPVSQSEDPVPAA